MAQHFYDVALCAAFWASIWGFDGARASGLRFVVGLALGALLARIGGLLFVPAGLWLAGPLAADVRARFLDAALAPLPLAFAVAKLGCVAAGCCTAAAGEAFGYAAVGAILRLGSQRNAGMLALAGIGAVRLAALPLRLDARGSALLAVVWLTLGALRCRPKQRAAPCPHPGSAISSRTPPSSRPGCGVSSAARATSR